MCEIMEKSEAGHLSAAAICALAEGVLPPEEALPLLEHLDACPDCMDSYIAALEFSELEELPAGLTERIQETVEREPVQETKTIAVFLPAVAKLLAAVTLTMVLFFTGVFNAIGSGAQELVESIGTSASAEPEEKPGGLAQWSEAVDQGIRNLMKQWDTLFTRR